MYIKIIKQQFEIPEDIDDIPEYFLLSASDPNSLYGIAILLRDGIFVPKNIEAAVEYLIDASKSNHGLAMYEYAVWLAFGLGIEQNQKKAKEYFRRAGHAGILDGIYFYADTLEKQEATKLFRKLAKLGNVKGLYDAALSFYTEDLQQAIIYLEKAALQNHPKAQYEYGIFLKKGIGIPKDEQAGNMYLRKAADQGLKEAQIF